MDESGKKQLKRTGIIAATTIGIAALVIPLVASTRDRDSSAATVEVEAPKALAAVPADAATDEEAINDEPAAPFAAAQSFVGESPSWPTDEETGETDWRVPVIAPFDKFPTDPKLPEQSFGCSPEQLAWLEAYAEPDSDDAYAYRYVWLANHATTGGSVAIENIRFIGASEHAVPVVNFYCPKGGEGGGDPQPIVVSSDGAPAVWGEGVFAQTGFEMHPVGSPAVINIAPGEVFSAPFIFDETFDRTMRWSGDVVGDITDSADDVAMLIPGFTFEREAEKAYSVRLDWSGKDHSCTTPFELNDTSYDNSWGGVTRYTSTCSFAEITEFLQALSDEYIAP